MRNSQKWIKKAGAFTMAMMLAVTSLGGINADAAKVKVKSNPIEKEKRNNTRKLHFEYSFGTPEFEVGTNGYEVLLDDAMAINETGMPDLPGKTISILLPQGKTVKSVSVKKANTQVYENMLVAPATKFAIISQADKTVSGNEVSENNSNTTDFVSEVGSISANSVEGTEVTEMSEMTEAATEVEGKDAAVEIEELEFAQRKSQPKTLIKTMDFTNSHVYNQSVYSGETTYPATDCSEGTIQTIRGFHVYTITLYPMSYSGTTLSYSSDMSLDITLTDDKETPEYVPTKEDLEFLSSDIDTSGVENTYFSTTSNEKAETETGQTLAGSGKIDYIIITNKALSKTFERLAEHKASKGLRTAVVTTEKIYKKYKGYDKAEKIRNFIQDAYKKNRVKYVLLGGDGDGKTNSKEAIVPTRMLYCKAVASGQKPTYIASDVYYSCLDGTYDNNRNHKYGEQKDGINGKDVDLIADVYVGRAPVDDEIEANNFITKVINYETRTKSAQALMIGEQLSGNISCSVELAANLQRTTSAESLTEVVRSLRDEKIKQEYIELYYDANEFMKAVYLDDLDLLAETVTLLVDYRQPIEEYVETGVTSKLMTRDDILILQSYCEELSQAIKKNQKKYKQKDRLVTELNEFVVYLGKCEGIDFGAMLDNSRFCRSEGESIDTSSFEKLDSIFGGTYKEEIRLGATTNKMTTRKIPDNYTVSTLYDKDSENQQWTEEQLLAALNSSPELINHLGHADVDSLMRLDVEGIKALKNENAFFFYSQGCYAGSFDNRNASNKYVKNDSVAEELLVSNETSGAFACVVNSRYGWYNSDPSSTKGPSQLYDRAFWDEAMYGKDKSLGVILTKSRQNKNLIGKLSDSTYGSVLRYCFYEITLLGDPETKLHDLKDPLFTQTTLQVKKTGNKRTLSWTTVEGAQKYIIYRSDSKNGVYTKLKTTQKNSYTDKTAKKGKKYYYKVAAYKKVGKTSYYTYSKPKRK